MSGRLPIIASVKEVYSGVANHFFQLFAAAWAWLLFGVGAMVWMEYLMASSGLSGMKPSIETFDIDRVVLLQIFLSIVIYVIATAGAAVKWHRFVLLGDYTSGHDANFTGNAMRYVWTTIKIGLVYMLLMIIMIAAMGVMNAAAAGGGGSIFGVLVGFIAAAFMFVGIPVVLRLSLALPDVALGGSGSLREMFGRTMGRGMQLLGYALLILLFLVLIGAVASIILSAVLMPFYGSEAVQNPTPEIELVMELLQLPVTVFAMMIGVTMLSVAYREIIGLPGQNSAVAAAQPTD